MSYDPKVLVEQAVDEGIIDSPSTDAAHIEIPPFYYDAENGRFVIPNERGGWVRVNETAVRRELRRLRFSEKIAEGACISPLDEALSRISKQHDMHYVGSLAGHNAGAIEINGRRVLVTDSPRIIQPVEGAWPTLMCIIQDMLYDPDYPQFEYFYGWLKTARESLVMGIPRPGQALVLAGPAESGKSLLQTLITLLLGGREARPYRYMAGKSEFNRELFAAEHLIIEDDNPSTDLRNRRSFGARLKEMTVNSAASCHGKNREAISLKPWWRLSISVNDEPENLMMLPPLDESLRDKVILLRVRRPRYPMPSDVVEKEKFLKGLLDELPGFSFFLDRWEIPNKMVSARFGVKHFLHPDLVEGIDGLAPEAKLRDLIDTTLFRNGLATSWQGSAAELERLLQQDGSPSQRQAEQLFSYNSACGVYLSRLATKSPGRFIHKKLSGGAVWTINPPGGMLG